MLNFKPDETFRDDYSFKNSDEAILRFPFPFDRDEYMYSFNVEPHKRGGPTAAYDHLFDLDEHYVAECRERAYVLAQDPSRCLSLPHMESAEWDTVELIMECLSTDYPEHFELYRDGADWTWVNRPLEIEQRFKFGKPDTLPYKPFEYITRQTQGDFLLQDQREDNLFIDAGMVTSQADWSLEFDVGMTFIEWHAPVPLAHNLGVFERALKYLMRLQYGVPVRRLNWTMTVNPRLDTSPENYPIWGPDRTSLTAENIGAKLHLRVELQVAWRLPRSNAILFSVRGYLASLDDITRVPKWGRRLPRVLKGLHPDIAAYKGLGRYRDLAISHLAQYDDGEETSLGTQADTERLTPLLQV